MKITLPHPHPALNPNGSRACWQSVSGQRRRARALAARLTEEAMENTDEAPLYTTYEIEWNSYGHQQADDDNIIARCKSYKDGICEALGINDKTLRCAGVSFTRDKATKKTLTITLRNSVLLQLPQGTARATVNAIRRLAELETGFYSGRDATALHCLADTLETQITAYNKRLQQ